MAIKQSQIKAATLRRQRAWAKTLRNKRRAFTASEVEEVRKLWVDTDLTRKQMARRFDVSVPTIDNVLSGRGAYKYDEFIERCPHGTKLD